MAEKQITIKIVGDASNVAAAMRTASGAADGLDKSLGTVVKTAAGFALGSAVTKAPGFLLDAAKAAAADEQSMNSLKQAVTNADGSYDKYGKTIDDAISKGQKLAFSDDDTRAALTALISETGSTEEGLKRLSTAQDLARGTGMSLEQAAKLLGKTSDENTSALARYGITVEKGATAQDVLNEVDARYKGQAGTYADSAAGQMAIMSDKAGELQESLGYILLPILAAVTAAMVAIVDAIAKYVVPALQSFSQTIEPVTTFISGNLTPILIALAPILGGIAVAILSSLIPALVAQIASLYATATAWIAANAAMGPIALILLAIGVAAVALYEAWSHNFLGIQDITDTVVSFVTDHLTQIATGLLLLLGPLGILFDAYINDWGGIREKTEEVVGWISETVPPILQAVWDAIQAGVDFIGPYISTFMGGIQTVFETVWPIVSGLVTTYIGLIRLEIETALTAIQLVWGIAWPAIQLVVEGVMIAISAAVTVGMGIVQVIQDGVQLISDAFSLVFAPISTIVSDTFTTISGLVTSLWGPAVSAITAGVDTAKGYFDSMFVPIQGVVSDVFNTIVSLVDSLWNGATGGVQKIKDGLQAAKDAFSKVYDTFKGYGSDIMQGLIDGLTSLWDTFTGWIDKIVGKLKIDVPGFSPPYDAGYEQGASFIQGLSTGISDYLPELGATVGNIGPILGNGIGAMPPSSGSNIGAMPPATNPWDNLTSNPVQPPAGSTPGAPLPAPWEQAPNPLDNMGPVGGKYGGGGPGGNTGSAYLKTSNGYTELTAAIRQAIKDGVREAMSGAMG